MAYGTIVARNTGSRACTITGYPGLTLIAGAGTVPTRLSRAAGITPSAVTLAPSASASFGFSHRVYPAGGHCDPINGARVYDPDGSGYRTTNTTFDEYEGITARGLKPVPIVVGPFEPGINATIGQ